MNFRRRCCAFLSTLEREAKRPRLTRLAQRQFSAQKATDLYKLLGVDRSANDSEIKKAYFKLAKQWHPDVNPSSEAAEKFAEISGAYETLSDKDKRSQYDMFGTAGGAGANPYDSGFGQSQGFQGFEEIFESLFGNAAKTGRRGTRNSAGNDIAIQETLTFMESITGCKKAVEINRMESCEVCDASGMEPGTSPVVCKHCKGAGRLRTNQGFLFMEQSCPFCSGEGSTFVPCRSCDGHGLTPKSVRLSVNIAAGVADNMKVRIANQGDASRYGGPRGNVLVHIRVLEDPVFVRHNNDVHLEVKIPLSLACTGGELKVPTLSGGDKTIELDAGVQHGDTKMIRGEGVKDFSSRIRGHLYVHFKIDIPKKLNQKQRSLLAEWVKEEKETVQVVERST